MGDIRPDYERGNVRLYCADCLDVLPELEAGAIDAIITDPPYGLTGKQDESAIVVDGHAPFMRHFGAWDQEWSPSALLNHANLVMRDGGTLIAFCAHEWIHAFSQTPLTEKKLGVWVKSNPAPRVRPGYQSGTEFWVWQSKGNAAPVWNGGFTQSNAIQFPVCAGNERTDHPTQKPLAMMLGFVSRHSDPGETILDPFMGSGTTGVAAVKLGRGFVGIERERKYFDVAVSRIDAAFDETGLLDYVAPEQGELLAAGDANA